jgi:formate dehydrogenase maturation protein FdhE
MTPKASSRYFIFLPLLSLAMCLPCDAVAQDVTADQRAGNASLSQQSAEGVREPKRGRWMENLSTAERRQLKAAHDAAIRDNPSLTQMMDEAKQKMEVAKKALNAAMIKADPSVEPLLGKIHQQRDPETKKTLSQSHSK